MGMRVATMNSYERGLAMLQKRQGDLAAMQEQMTSGKRVARASDDPTDAARAERAMIAQMRTVADQRAVDASRRVTLQAETALGNAGELVMQARDLMLAAGNPTYSDAERRDMGDALRGLREQLLSVANRSDGAGAYLFGGQGATRPPFVDAPGGVRYEGDTGETRSAGAEPLPLALDGRITWLQARDPVTGGATLSVFDALDRMAAELQTPGRTGDAISQAVQAGVAELDAVADRLQSSRSRLGELINRADAVEVRLSQQGLTAAAERSAAEDLDMVQAVSDFQNQQTGYDAALRAYSMVQRLSLFDYIGG
jgi:flagellar hook-associated protein 3 FlgL